MVLGHAIPVTDIINICLMLWFRVVITESAQNAVLKLIVAFVAGPYSLSRKFIIRLEKIFIYINDNVDARKIQSLNYYKREKIV